MILRYQLGQLQTNSYFLIKGDNCLLIDPADEASFILDKLEQKKLNLVGILATHGHFDHIGAVGEIQLTYHVPLFFSKKDQFLVDRLNQTAKYFLGFDPHFLPPMTVKYLTVKKLKVSNFELQIIPCPGHTPGSVSYYLPEKNILFSGDTLFKAGVGRYDFSYSNKKDLKESLKKLFKLPKKTAVYPGHGEKTFLEDEKEIVTTIY